MMHTDTNEENLGAYIKLLDAALQHEVCGAQLECILGMGWVDWGHEFH